MLVIDLNLVERVSKVQYSPILASLKLISDGIWVQHQEFLLRDDIVKGTEVYRYSLVSIFFANNYYRVE